MATRHTLLLLRPTTGLVWTHDKRWVQTLLNSKHYREEVASVSCWHSACDNTLNSFIQFNYNSIQHNFIQFKVLSHWLVFNRGKPVGALAKSGSCLGDNDALFWKSTLFTITYLIICVPVILAKASWPKTQLIACIFFSIFFHSTIHTLSSFFLSLSFIHTFFLLNFERNTLQYFS